MAKKNKYIGSNFDDFLKKEGMLEGIKETVSKKIHLFLNLESKTINNPLPSSRGKKCR